MKHFVISILILVFLINPVTLNVTKATIYPDDVVYRINQERTAKGLVELKVNEKLALAAKLKAYDMLLRQYFAHDAPDALKPWDFVRVAEYDYLIAGENLAIGFTDSELAVRAWMASPGHRYNILNPEYEETGLYVLEGNFKDQGRLIIIVQFFGKAKQENG